MEAALHVHRSSIMTLHSTEVGGRRSEVGKGQGLLMPLDSSLM